MNTGKGVAYSLLASLAFAAPVPATKALLASIHPVMMAGMCYFSAGVGLLLYRLAFPRSEGESPIPPSGRKWLLASITAGGILAPILLMSGIAMTAKASFASVLFSSEVVFTALIAWLFFREHLSARFCVSLLLLVGGATALSWNPELSSFHLDKGLLMVLAACFLWGFDNNFTARLSGADPVTVACCKGLAAGFVNIALALLLGAHFPPLPQLLGAAAVGVCAYGLSIVLIIYGMRYVGAARGAAIFGSNPFLGALLCVAFLGEGVSAPFLLGFAACVAAMAVMMTEKHSHSHRHEGLAHEHGHTHADGHHRHVHTPGDPEGEPHVHTHVHEGLEHSHDHSSDAHHLHRH